MASLVFFMIMLHLQLLVYGSENNYRSEGFMDRLTNGMKFAKDFLGSEIIAQKVAEFVVKAFQPANKVHKTRTQTTTDNPYINKYEMQDENEPQVDVHEVPSPLSPLRHLVRLLGLKPTQISAVAINALVFVAQMISTFLAGPKRSNKPYRTDDPTNLILNKNSRRLQDIIATAKNESLPEIISDLIKERGSEEETSCIRLLVCKVAPFVSRMQKVVFDKENIHNVKEERLSELRGAEIMYHYLPSSIEVTERNSVCERLHRDCKLDDY